MCPSRPSPSTFFARCGWRLHDRKARIDRIKRIISAHSKYRGQLAPHAVRFARGRGRGLAAAAAGCLERRLQARACVTPNALDAADA